MALTTAAALAGF